LSKRLVSIMMLAMLLVCTGTWALSVHPVKQVKASTSATPSPYETATAIVNFTPPAFNLVAKGIWTTVYIELPSGYDVNGTEVSNVAINKTIYPDPSMPAQIGDFDHDSIPDLMVEFDRTKIIDLLLALGQNNDTAILTLTARLNQTISFEGSEAVKFSKMGGDVNCDGTVGLFDAVATLSCYGAREDEPNWNPNANFLESWNVINLYDVIVIVAHYGQPF